MYYVPDNYTVADSTLNSVYTALQKKYWTLSRVANQLTECYGAEVKNGGTVSALRSSTTRRMEPTIIGTTRSSILLYLEVNCVTLTPLCLTLAENDSKGKNAGTRNPIRLMCLPRNPRGCQKSYVSLNGLWLNDDGVTYHPEQRTLPSRATRAQCTIQANCEVPLNLINDLPATTW
jgi:hypothetical protein